MRVKIKMKDYILIIDEVKSITYDKENELYIITKSSSMTRIDKCEVDLIQIV